MRINNCINSVSNTAFSATFVKKVPVMKFCPTENVYKPIEADLIKLDPKNADDVKMAEKICFNDKFRSYGEYLFGMWLNKKWNYPSVKSNSLYGLVLPKEEGDNTVTIKDVLGVTEFVENKDNKINKIMFMITNKDYQNNPEANSKEYTHIGKGMTDALKELYPQKPIGVFAEWDAIKFWQKQGFENKTQQRNLIYNG